MTWRLDQGDALELLRELPDESVDAVVTDPPYTAAGGSTNGRNGIADGQFFLHWLRALCGELRRVTKADGCMFVFADWRTVGVIQQAMSPPGERHRGEAWEVTQALVWDREAFGLGSPFRNGYEMIAFARGPAWSSTMERDISTVVRFRWAYGRKELHGAEKPVGLVRKLVEWATPRGGVVLDPFAGSGTTGVACLELGRGFVGMEIDPDFHAKATERISAASLLLTTKPVSLPMRGGLLL